MSQHSSLILCYFLILITVTQAFSWPNFFSKPKFEEKKVISVKEPKEEESENQFDINHIENLWDLSRIAYGEQEFIEKWKCNKDLIKKLGIDKVKVFENQYKNIQAVIGESKQQKRNYIIFRGTEISSLKNILTDMNFSFINYEFCENCKVHSGFYTAYESIYNDTINYLKQQTHKNKYPLVITGHSLGGAIASLFAFYLNKLEQNIQIQSVITFGSPRIGNKNFSEHWNTEMKNITNYRVTNFQDFVPHLPLSKLGYYHVSNEIWLLPEEQEKYKICEPYIEDQTCSCGVSLFARTVADHRNYFGRATTDEDIYCFRNDTLIISDSKSQTIQSKLQEQQFALQLIQYINKK